MTESHLTYTNGVVDVPAGTVLQLRNFTGSPPLAASDLGDQLLAYVGNSSNPTFLCGIDTTAAGWFVPCAETCNYANDGFCDDGGPGAEFTQCAIGSDCADCGVRNQTRPPADRSYLPSTLVDGYSAVAFGHYDNNAYRGTNIGTIAQLRAAITSAANWAKSNSVVTAAINVMNAFEPKPKPKGKDGKDGKTLTHTPSKKALRDPNAARAEAYAKVLRDPKTSRRKEAAKNDVEYAAETAAVQVAVRAAVSNPPHREHEAPVPEKGVTDGPSDLNA
ncbi:hypothetical protein Ctob_015320 [Chrysochromulina tobinii]|uniref:Uncharacterized protein n=1 Tax=Chrysochromulina tobinii TaxID=1460289 RepID=A0A0M0KD43_9EUKA|nr:hypothetical protein Ctob_015320 [Chrysochromulina tobinii]|eukprot:KOO36776.1 hypothetical protein Ctob_015320 [Chrysochromulina sp. CCMP291]